MGEIWGVTNTILKIQCCVVAVKEMQNIKCDGCFLHTYKISNCSAIKVNTLIVFFSVVQVLQFSDFVKRKLFCSLKSNKS